MRHRRTSARSSSGGTRGFTLIELLVAFSVASVVIVAVGSGFVFVTRAWTDQLGRVQTQQALRTTVESITRELRLAGACMPSPTLPPIATTYDPYQPLTGTHGTTDSITITSNPACAGPTAVTTPCNGCTSIVVQNTTNFTAGMWAYIYNSDTTTSPPGPFGESFLIQSVNTGTNTITVSSTKALAHNYPAVGPTYKSSLYGMDQRVFAISSTCAGCNGVPSLTLTPIGGQAQPLVKGIDSMLVTYVLNRVYAVATCEGQTGGTSSLCAVNLPTTGKSIAGDWQLVRAITFTFDARSTFPVRASGGACGYSDGFFHLCGAFEISPRNFMFQQSTRVPWTPY